jgi:hypothetical protein
MFGFILVLVGLALLVFPWGGTGVTLQITPALADFRSGRT